MASWVKKNCYVVHAYYRDELYQNNEAPMKEEEVFFSESKAEQCKEKYEADSDFESVDIEEEVREFWVDDDEEEKIKISQMSDGELLACLDDEVQKLVGADNVEWATNKKVTYQRIRNELVRRLENE